MKSELDELLTNNDSPSFDTLQKAQELLVNTQREITDTEAQIAALTTHLSSLEAQFSKYQTITSPFRRIPIDLLHEIFYHCLPSYRNPLLIASEAPVLLTRVCSRWRTVALSSSRLWAQVHITFCDRYLVLDPMPNHVLDGEVERRRRQALHVLNLRCQVVREWLGRAGTYPLSISIFFSNSTWNIVDNIDTDTGLLKENGNPNPAMTLFQTIAQFLHCCRRLELNMPIGEYQKLDAMIANAAIDLRAMKALNISYHSSSVSSPSNLKCISSLLKAPHLESLSSLTGLGPTFSDLLLTSAARGENLTHLCCNDHLTATENLSILNKCGNLVHCKISIKSGFNRGAVPDDAFPTAVVFLPRLLSFSISEDTSVHLDHVFIRQLYSSIDAPKLKWINYENNSYRRSTPPPSTAPILPLLRNSTQLAKLTLEPRYFSPRDLREVFEVVSPTLIHLVLGHEASLRRHTNELGRRPRFDLTKYDFLEWLSIESESDSKPPLDSTSSILLPHLEAFEWFPGMEPDETILRFVTSRMTAASVGKVAPLMLVRVRHNRPKQLDIEQELIRFLSSRGNEGTNALGPGAQVKLDLQYLPPVPTYVNPLSASYNVEEKDEYWNSSETNEMYMPG